MKNIADEANAFSVEFRDRVRRMSFDPDAAVKIAVERSAHVETQRQLDTVRAALAQMRERAEAAEFRAAEERTTIEEALGPGAADDYAPDLIRNHIAREIALERAWDQGKSEHATTRGRLAGTERCPDLGGAKMAKVRFECPCGAVTIVEVTP